MRFITIITLSLLFIASSCSTKQFNQPNILLINIDDMGWKDVGFMGSEYYETPNIDALSFRANSA